MVNQVFFFFWGGGVGGGGYSSMSLAMKKSVSFEIYLSHIPTVVQCMLTGTSVK